MNKEDKLGGQDGGTYSATGSSAHYNQDFIEFIDNIEVLAGSVAAFLCCESNVTKYRGRAGKKSGVPMDKDIQKAFWYSACGSYLKEKIDLYNKYGPSYSNPEWIDFFQKYGSGRVYVRAPFQVRKLYKTEFELPCVSAKPLGDIVDEKLKK